MMWMLLQAVGCHQETVAMPPVEASLVTPPAVEKTPRYVPGDKSFPGGPPLGDGPWNVKINGAQVGRIFGYGDENGNKWMHYVERLKGGGFLWAKDGVSWSVEVAP